MSEVENLQLSRACVALQAEDKKRRKRALEDLDKLVFGQDESIDLESLVTAWTSVHQNIVRLLTDPSEACRDSCIELLKKFLSILPPNAENLTYVLPIMSRRLGPQELIEPSEEVRLNLILLLRLIIDKHKDCLRDFVDDIVTILKRTVTDNYPNVKKESCACISDVAKTLPSQFYNCSDTFIKPIVSNLTHQHFKVRVAAVNSISDVIQYGNSKSVPDVATPLAERLFDQSSAVRMAVVQTAGQWLLELRDRYSWWHKLIPLLLTGLHDEIEAIRSTAGKLWQAVGEQYMSENDTDQNFKDKMDFEPIHLEHYPTNILRPNLGCRTIAQQNLSKLIGAIATELGDWKADIRVRAAQLLCVLVLNVEQDITQHLVKIMPAMYRACNDGDSRVVQNVELAANYIGYFVPPEIYCRCVLPMLEDNPTPGHLRVFSAILRGSNRKNLVAKIEQVVEYLQEPDVCRGKTTEYQEQILRCCQALIIVCKEDCQTISQDIFTVIFTVLALASEEKIQHFAEELLAALVEIEQLKNLEELYDCHLRMVLKLISSNPEAWTIYDAEFLILRASLVHTGPVASRYLDLILPMLQRSMITDGDAQLRLKLFLLLCDYLERREQTLRLAQNLPHFMNVLLEEIIVPSLTWSAGRVAEAIRTAAACCLCSALDESPINDDDAGNKVQVQLFSDGESFLKLFETMVPILISLADDNVKNTRLYSLRALQRILVMDKNLSCINEDHVHRVYPVVLKRLDDGCDDVRYLAVETLAAVWSGAPENYDKVFSKSHIDATYTSAIVHLDDPEPKFQEAMLGTMKELVKIYPELLVQKLEKCQNNFRNRSGIDALLNAAHEALLEKSKRM